MANTIILHAIMMILGRCDECEKLLVHGLVLCSATAVEQCKFDLLSGMKRFQAYVRHSLGACGISDFLLRWSLPMYVRLTLVSRHHLVGKGSLTSITAHHHQPPSLSLFV
jgi:Zn-dependent alcohol dehydrogenase